MTCAGASPDGNLVQVRCCFLFRLPHHFAVSAVPLPMHPALRRLYARSVFFPTLGWNFALARFARRRNWWDFIDPFVIVGAYPFSRDVEAMHAAGVRAVVNTCEEYAGP